MKKLAFLLAFPNPFQRLDHEGVPAGTFPYDPSHSPDRRWVGATVDRSPGPNGLPRTRPLDTEGDLTAVLPKGRLRGKVIHVDRAPRKRIQFAFDLAAPSRLPATSAHYHLGFRQRSLFPADEATACALGLPFVDPALALRSAATHAIGVWKREHGEEPDVSLWPTNLRKAAGILPDEAPPDEPVASDEEVGGETPAEPTEAAGEAKDAALDAGGGEA